MKRHELFWMLLPCLGLALFAIVLSNRPGANLILDRGPFQLTIENVQRESVTAYEVSEGYDSKIKIIIGHRGGKLPAWWGTQSGGWGSSDGVRLMSEQNGKLRPLKIPGSANPSHLLYWRPSWDDENKHYVARILMHLSDVPPHMGRIIVQANMAIQSNMSTPISAPLRFSHVVGEAGQKVEVPVVSRDTNLKLENIEVSPIPPVELKTAQGTGVQKITARVRITLLRAQKENAGSAFGSSQLQDEKGGIWSVGSSGTGSDAYDMGASNSDPLHERREFLHFDCDLTPIPAKAGRVWLKTHYSTNHSWPLQIKVPVRDAQGRTLYTPVKPAPFIVESTKMRAADAQEKNGMGVNTVLEVTLKYTGILPAGRDAGQLPWRADWSQYLKDERGKEYWTFTRSNSGKINTGTSWSGHIEGAPPERRVKILYYLPLQKMPARLGRIKFHADISLPGTASVPVEVIVRQSKLTPTA